MMAIPPHLVRALGILNAARTTKLPTPKRLMVWDDRLGRSAQELAEWAHAHKAKGGNVMADAHHDHLGRIERSGWDMSGPPPHDSRPGVGNNAECGCPSENDDQYPVKTPEAHAHHLVWMLCESDLSKDRTEGHVWDFNTSWTHVGIGFKGGFFCLDYGYIPGTPDLIPPPDPGPVPTPIPTPPEPAPGPVVIDVGGFKFHMM